MTEQSPTAIRAAQGILARARWHSLELVFWIAAFSAIWLLPSKHLILTEIAWLALFALSLDMILGYAGILSLGHAAFFGVGSYAAALLAKHGIITEPVLALVAAGLIAAVVGFATSFLMLRGADLTRLMVSLGVALVLRELANKFSDLTGGADGLQGVTMEPILGRFRFDMFGHNGFVYCLIVLFVLFLIARRLMASPFGLALLSVKGNPLARAPSASASMPVWWRSIRSRLSTPALPAASWRRHRRSRRSTSSRSTARPTCCWCSSSAAPAISMAG